MLQAVVLLLAGAVCAAPSIRLEKTELSYPTEGKVRVHVAAVGDGVEVGSYGLRTLKKDAPAPAGFTPRAGYSFLAIGARDDPLWYLLRDGMPGDLDAEKDAVACEMDVASWPSGDHRFLLFACNRPAGGAYVHDVRVLRIVVEGGRPVRGKTTFLSELSVKISRFAVEPPRVRPGEPFTVTAQITAAGVEGVQAQLTVPYTVAPQEAPPGFAYVAAEKKAYLPAQPQRIALQPDAKTEGLLRGTAPFTIPTTGWKPGVWNLTLDAAAQDAPTAVRDYVDLAVTVLPDSPRFEATLEHDQFLKPGTHFGCFCRLSDGSVAAYERVTRDGGLTWQAPPNRRAMPMPHQLRDGTILGVAFHTQPIEDRPGYFTGALFTSPDGWETVTEEPCEVHVPRATGGIGHAAVKGPLFWRSMVEMPDGALLALMYGWFEGDESPVPGQPGSFRYRTFLTRSTDRGKHWEHHATVAYDPKIGTEGYCEPVMRLLPNGELLCLLRTGGNNRVFHQDNPLCVTRSADGGKTWTEPARTGFEGVAPDLVVMADGTLACSAGRPGAWVLLSTDNGQTWGEAISIDAERYSGYTAITEVEQGVLLVGYGAMGRRDPKTGDRDNHLRTVRVRLKRLEREVD